MDKRAAVVLAVIFGGLFLVLFGFLFLAYSAVKTTTVSGLDAEVSTSVGPRVGIVECRGTVGDNERGIDSEKIVKLLRKYERDDDVKAVVVRVDSPGGAVAPSQEIYSAIRNLRKKKKVVVSMGNRAASGGYYISAAADQIYASPGTLTGSIGVIFMHFNVRPLLETVKVEETTLKSGKYKDTFSPFRPIQEQDREEVQGLSDDVRAAMELANREAKRHRRPAIDPLHLLIGLAREWTGLAGILLRRKGMEPGRVRRAVRAAVWSCFVKRLAPMQPQRGVGGLEHLALRR